MLRKDIGTEEKVILRLYASHSVLFSFTTNDTLISYLERLLDSIPGVSRSDVCLVDLIVSDEKMLSSRLIGQINLDEEVNIDSFNKLCEFYKKKNIEIYPIRTVGKLYGIIALEVSDFEKYKDFDPIVNNFAISVSFILENRFQREMLEKSHEALKMHEKHLEELVATKTASLNEAIKNQEMYTVKLETANKDLQQFAYTISHDLQEPLRTISSYLQLIERRYKNQLDKDVDDFISFSIDAAMRLQKMINDLLTFSRVQTHGKSFEETDCNIILNEAISNLTMAISESHASITFDKLPIVVGDESQLIQLFQNLLSNAIKFRKKGVSPVIHVSAKFENHEWVFKLSDNGIGIPPEDLDKLFIIFSHLAGKNYPGSGVGLAVCKRIIDRHHGQIWVESEVDKGSTFYFTIPERKM